MRTLIARTTAAAALALLGLALPAASTARAQALGPQRQFLAIEPYYTRFELDTPGSVDENGQSSDRTGVNGYGARLWINLAPFSGPGNNILGRSAIALFYTYAPSTDDLGASLSHYGAQVDYFFVNRPLGGFIDPVISGAVGGYRTKTDDFTDPLEGITIRGESQTKLALSPSIGIRIPVPNRFQLRFDARNAFVLKGSVDDTGRESTASHLEFIGAVGITF